MLDLMLAFINIVVFPKETKFLLSLNTNKAHCIEMC